MLQARNGLKRVRKHSHGVIWVITCSLIVSLSVLPTPSTAATTFSTPDRGVAAVTVTSSPARHPLSHHRATSVVVELADFTNDPTPIDGYVVGLIHRDFPTRAWHDAEAVAWCESKFRPTDMGFDSNGTHDRGVFQLNDGGTEQYLMAMIGQNPDNLNLAFNPVLNVRAAALLYARDGWSQWSCATAI
jgi:hypothetical protein